MKTIIFESEKKRCGLDRAEAGPVVIKSVVLKRAKKMVATAEERSRRRTHSHDRGLDNIYFS